jgi:hypothetical protein
MAKFSRGARGGKKRFYYYQKSKKNILFLACQREGARAPLAPPPSRAHEPKDSINIFLKFISLITLTKDIK